MPRSRRACFTRAANFARLRNLPVLFVCENNLYSVYTRLEERPPARPLTDVARAHDIPTQHHDGNDVEGVYRTTLDALQRARRGDGPSFLLFDTYRWREHCGPNFDNHIGYREESEYETWRARDPLEAYRKQLSDAGILDTETQVSLQATLQSTIDAAFGFAKASPLPDPATAFEHVYA